MNTLAMQLLSGVLLAVATGYWIPSVVRAYGREYFGWPMSRRMPAASVALLVGASLAWFGFAVRLGASPLPIAAMIAALAGVIAADTRFHLIPDRFQLLGLAGALAFAAERGSFENIGFAVIVGAAFWALNAIYRLVRKRDGLGFGDVKLMVWLEIALGQDVIAAVLFACIAAALVMAPRVIRQRMRLDAGFAFGPYLVIGVAAVVALNLI